MPEATWGASWQRDVTGKAPVRTRAAEEVAFLTVWTPPERLRDQITRARIEPHTWFGRHLGPKRRLRILEDYRDPARVAAHYRRWFDYARTRSDDHTVVCMDEPVRIFSVKEWEETVAPKLEGR